jgi:hypothetical protein
MKKIELIKTLIMAGLFAISSPALSDTKSQQALLAYLKVQSGAEQQQFLDSAKNVIEEQLQSGHGANDAVLSGSQFLWISPAPALPEGGDFGCSNDDECGGASKGCFCRHSGGQNQCGCENLCPPNCPPNFVR